MNAVYLFIISEAYPSMTLSKNNALAVWYYLSRLSETLYEASLTLETCVYL